MRQLRPQAQVPELRENRSNVVGRSAFVYVAFGGENAGDLLHIVPAVAEAEQAAGAAVEHVDLPAAFIVDEQSFVHFARRQLGMSVWFRRLGRRHENTFSSTPARTLPVRASSFAPTTSGQEGRVRPATA